MKRIAIVAILAVAVIAVGAGAVYYQGAYMAPIPGPITSPTVSITSPSNGGTIQGSTVTVTVASTGFSVPAQGHYHVYLDSTLLMAFDQASTVTFTNVAPGTHTITAYLANPDHSLVSPAVSQIITINVASPASAPTVSVTSPANGATVSDTFTVTVSSANFNVPAKGHYHVYLDGQISAEKMAFSQVSTVTFNNVAPGTHTITAYLANPDHSAIQPSVSRTITVNVEQSGGGAQPTVSILSPASGATVQGSAVTVTVSSSNFNIPSQGYYYVTMSNGGFITGNGPTFNFPSVTSGTHTITAQLYNADGTPVSPAVSQTVTITVTGGASSGGGGGGGGGGGY